VETQRVYLGVHLGIVERLHEKLEKVQKEVSIRSRDSLVKKGVSGIYHQQQQTEGELFTGDWWSNYSEWYTLQDLTESELTHALRFEDDYIERDWDIHH